MKRKATFPWKFAYWHKIRISFLWRYEMRKIILVLALIVLMSNLVFAQVWKGKGRLLGYVYDTEGNPLEGVKVKLIYVRGNVGFDVVSDAQGKWNASWIRNGAWNIDFEKAGYMPKQISVEISEVRKNPDITVNLEKAEGLLLTDELKNALNEGNTLFDEEKYEEAIAVYNKILEDYPDAYVIHKNIGNAYFQLEKYDEAEENYKKVLEQVPDDNEVKMLIGNCYSNQNENEKAIEWYGKIDFEKISDPIVLYNIGSNYKNLSKYEEALRYYKRSVEIKEDFLDGLYQLGLTYLTLGQFPEAITVFENYLKHDSESERANQVKGFIEYLKRRIE